MMYGRYRKLVQISVFLIMFFIPVLNLWEIYYITGTFYAVNIGGLGISDPVVILQAIFASGEITLPLLTAALFPILTAAIFGRIWCGWMCPYHLLADITAFFRSRLFKTTDLFASSHRANVIRYGVLILGTLTAGALSIPILNYISAPGILSTESMIFVKEHGVSIEFGFIIMLIALELLILPRFWCRFFCPTGSFLSLFRTSFTLRVGTESKVKSACCAESHCTHVCPMGLAPYREGSNLLCVNCGKCVDACKSGRLKFRGFDS